MFSKLLNIISQASFIFSWFSHPRDRWSPGGGSEGCHRLLSSDQLVPSCGSHRQSHHDLHAQLRPLRPNHSGDFPTWQTVQHWWSKARYQVQCVPHFKVGRYLQWSCHHYISYRWAVIAYNRFLFFPFLTEY